MRSRRITTMAVGAVLAIGAAACGGGDETPEATPAQAEAISILIDTELTSDEQTCILEELIATGIEPQAILEGTVTGDEDAELLAIAVSCVADLAAVPAFVQSVIEASAETGTPFTEAEAVCVIEQMGDADPVTAAAGCIEGGREDGNGDAGGGPAETYGDDRTLDLLWDACESGNNQACDELYTSAPLDTEYLEFARTCAGRLPDSMGLRCFLDLD